MSIRGMRRDDCLLVWEPMKRLNLKINKEIPEEEFKRFLNRMLNLILSSG